MLRFNFQENINGYWKGRIFVVEPVGNISIESVYKTKEKMVSVVSRAPNGPWCRLEYFKDDDSLLTFDSVDSLEQSVVHNKKKGCIKIGLIGGNSVLRYLFKNITQQVGIEFQSYDSFVTAIVSLENHIDSRLQRF